MRTLGSIREQNQKFISGGSKNPRNFDNCINQPLFLGPDSMRIFEVCPMDELHLFLGITKHIVDSLNEAWGGNQLNDWLEHHGIRREKYYNGAMNGNACNKLLNKKLHLLRRKVPKKHLKFVTVLESFNKVKKSSYL